MELRQIEYFLAACREGSITGAAESLYLAQPSLSHQIRKLEQELGAALFDRLPRGLQLTSAGEAFRTHALRAMQDLEDGRTAVSEILGVRRGRIAIGVLPSVGAKILPGIITEFRRLHPEIEVSLTEETDSGAVEEMVRNAQVDLAIVRASPSSGLASVDLLTEPIRALTPPGHRLAGVGSIRLAELADEPFVAHRQGYGLRTFLIETCRRAGFEPRIVVEAEQLEFLRGLVYAGFGVTILPEMATGGQQPSLVLTDSHAERTLSVVWRHTSLPSATARAFVDVCRSVTASELADPADPAPRGSGSSE